MEGHMCVFPSGLNRKSILSIIVRRIELVFQVMSFGTQEQLITMVKVYKNTFKFASQSGMM